MRGIRTLRIISDNLRSVDLHALRRPSVKPHEPKTEELVRWGICMYVYSLIAHMQKILPGLLSLAESGNVAATAPLGRHVFEWTALSCRLTKKLRELFEKHDWGEAWAFLTKADLGSDWAGKFGSKYAGDPAVKLPFEIPQPVRVGAAVEDYEAYQQRNSREPEAKDSYSLLPLSFADTKQPCSTMQWRGGNFGSAALDLNETPAPVPAAVKHIDAHYHSLVLKSSLKERGNFRVPASAIRQSRQTNCQT